MPLNQKEQKLLKSATTYLPTEFREFLINHLSVMMGQSQWFREKLLHSLDRGVLFRIAEKGQNASPIRYTHEENAIIFGSSQFISTIPRVVAKAYLGTLLRSAITFAYDISSKNDRLIPYYLTKANLLLNALACISDNNHLNPKYLDTLALQMIDYNVTGQISYLNAGKWASVLEISSSRMLETVGSFIIPHTFTAAVLAIYKYPDNGGFYAVLTSVNRVRIYKRFAATNAARQSSVGTEIDLYVKLITPYLDDSDKLQFWNSLTEKRRDTLDGLYAIQECIVHSIAEDPFCSPEFKLCIQNNEKDCFNSLINCQLSASNPDNFSISVWKTHACMQARAEGHYFNELALGDLCEPFAQSLPSASSAPLESSANSRMNGFIYSTGLSFVNDVTDSYVKKRGYSYQEQLRLMVNLSYVISVGCIQYYSSEDRDASVLTQIALPAALIFIKQALESYTQKLGLGKLVGYAKHAGNAVITGITFYQDAKSAVVNVLGSITGSLLAKSFV